LIGLVIRLTLIPSRWISPDEGWHLTDVWFILSGKIPIVDFPSRQPLYVYSLAGFVKLFGNSIFVARMLPVIITSGIGFSLFLLSKKMFDKKVAFLSLIIYTFLPISIVFSPLVREEPLAILFSIIGFYFFTSLLLNSPQKNKHLFLSGVFIALAYYSRQTNLAMFFAILLFFFLVLVFFERNVFIFKAIGVFGAGFFCVSLFFFIIFAGIHDFSTIWDSQINPFQIILKNLKNILISFQIIQPESIEPQTFRFVGQEWNKTVDNFKQTVNINLFLFVGLVLAFFKMIFFIIKRIKKEQFEILGLLLLFSWLFGLTLFYGFHFIQRGYFVQYIREFLPPIIILTSFILKDKILNIAQHIKFCRTVFIFVISSVLVFWIYNLFEMPMPSKVSHVILGTIIMIGILVIIKINENRKRTIFILSGIVFIFILLTLFPPIQNKGVLLGFALVILIFSIWLLNSKLWRIRTDTLLNFVFLSFFFGSLIYGSAESGRLIDMSYKCGWSPQALDKVVDHVTKNSSENDKMMSGVLVWSFQSKLNPFPSHGHPDLFSAGIPDYIKQELEDGFTAHSPKFIVDDGYLFPNYHLIEDQLKHVLQNNYQLLFTISDSKKPVSLYQINQ